MLKLNWIDYGSPERNPPAAFGRLCVETIRPFRVWSEQTPAAFGRLCVETDLLAQFAFIIDQPPSGGCVLKREKQRLLSNLTRQPPSGGCVLKHTDAIKNNLIPAQPPSGGCVLKLPVGMRNHTDSASRLRAAVC